MGGNLLWYKCSEPCGVITTDIRDGDRQIHTAGVIELASDLTLKINN